MANGVTGKRCAQWPPWRLGYAGFLGMIPAHKDGGPEEIMKTVPQMLETPEAQAARPYVAPQLKLV